MITVLFMITVEAVIGFLTLVTTLAINLFLFATMASIST